MKVRVASSMRLRPLIKFINQSQTFNANTFSLPKRLTLLDLTCLVEYGDDSITSITYGGFHKTAPADPLVDLSIHEGSILHVESTPTNEFGSPQRFAIFTRVRSNCLLGRMMWSEGPVSLAVKLSHRGLWSFF